MATFKEIKANSIYRVSGDAWSTNWGNYPSGYYMTLDTLEAITTPLRNKRTVWQTNEDGEFLRDEDSYRIAVLDDDGNEVKEFEYNRNSKKGSIWMIRIPDAVIKTVGIYETQTILEDEDYWDDPNVPEYYDKEVRIGTKLNREVGERPEIDLDDLHLVQTRHIDDYCRGDSLEAFYASHDEDYLRDQADKSASALAQATNQRKVSELSDDTWDLFVNTEGEKLFDPEKYRGESNRERYTKGEDHGGRYDYRPRISYGTLYAVNDLFRELKRSQEMANYWYEKYTEQCRVVEKMQGE